VNRAKRKGTGWETTLVEFLRANGAPHAERRAQGGTKDRGDIAGIPGLVIEAKAEKAVNLAGWIAEAEVERVNDGSDVAVVWAKRVRKAGAADGYIVMTPECLVRLLVEAGYLAATTD
jgi:hypothetical protein